MLDAVRTALTPATTALRHYLNVCMVVNTTTPKPFLGVIMQEIKPAISLDNKEEIKNRMRVREAALVIGGGVGISISRMRIRKREKIILADISYHYDEDESSHKVKDITFSFEELGIKAD